MESGFGPDNCIRRWCTICGREMRRKYDSDSHIRVYDFECTRCHTTVRLFEEIFEEMRQAFKDDGRNLEPLTKEEQAKQAYSMTSDGLFEGYTPNLRRLRDKYERDDNMKRLDDKEMERLR